MSNMFPDKCQRCGGSFETNGSHIHTTSMFNKETICMACKDREKHHPLYKKAVEADHEHIRNGDYNFEGIGCPPELYEKENRDKEALDDYIGKFVANRDGLKGKCIGVLPENDELVIIPDKGGRVVHFKKSDVAETTSEPNNQFEKVIKATTICFTTTEGSDATQFDTQDVAELLELFTHFINENKFALKSVDSVEFVDLNE